MAYPQTIPTSQRSQAIIQKLSPVIDAKLQQAGLKLGNEVYIRIFKAEAQLQMWVKNAQGFSLFKTYPICTFGNAGLGAKMSEGDGKAPEGFYYVTAQQLNPHSQYHLSFNLGYPNAYDKAHNRTGSALMVHGDCVSIGCYAMTDAHIEEIYTLVHAALTNGQGFFRVHIFPFYMTDENMRKHKNTQWQDFWINLKQGYDYFEHNNFNPPNVKVKNRIYVFE